MGLISRVSSRTYRKSRTSNSSRELSARWSSSLLFSAKQHLNANVPNYLIPKVPRKQLFLQQFLKQQWHITQVHLIIKKSLIMNTQVGATLGRSFFRSFQHFNNDPCSTQVQIRSINHHEKEKKEESIEEQQRRNRYNFGYTTKPKSWLTSLLESSSKSSSDSFKCILHHKTNDKLTRFISSSRPDHQTITKENLI